MFDKLVFIWRFRMVKIRKHMAIWGMAMSGTGAALTMLLTLIQQFVGHSVTIEWNFYNEATIEFVWTIITIPCVIYFYKISIQHIEDIFSCSAN